MRSIKLWLVVAILLSLFTGCGDKKDANESNFKEAINKQFKNDCISFGVFKFPTKETKDSYDRKELDSLVKVGLVSVTDTKIPNPYNTKKIEDGFEYQLNDLGKKSFVQKDQFYKLCTGKYKVISIDNFTEPANMAWIGMMVSEIQFKKEAIDVPSWAYELVKEEVFKKFTEKISKEPQSDHTILALTNNGWMTEEEFKESKNKK